MAGKTICIMRPPGIQDRSKPEPKGRGMFRLAFVLVPGRISHAAFKTGRNPSLQAVVCSGWRSASVAGQYNEASQGIQDRPDQEPHGLVSAGWRLASALQMPCITILKTGRP